MLTKQKIHKLYLLVSALVILHGTMLFMLVDGQLQIEYFGFFTVISNLLVAVVFIIMLAAYNKRTMFWHYVLMSMLMSISATALTYNLVLVPVGGSNMVFSDYPNFVIHLLSAILVFGNYFIFEKKGIFKFSHVRAGLIIPFVYYLASLSIGYIIDSYPYFFMRPDVVGWPMVFIIFGALMGLLFLFGYLIMAFDRGLYKRILNSGKVQR